MVGIYKITNNINGKAYIGQSKNIERRWKQHIYHAINSNEDCNSLLYKAIHKYGIENFKFEVITECSIDELDKLEIFYIEQYDTYYNGYNLTLGGSGNHNEINKEKILGIISDLENTEMSHREIAQKWDMSIGLVQGINTGRYYTQNREYPIQKSSSERQGHKIYHYCSVCGCEITRYGKVCRKCYDLQRRTVERPSREILKQLIREKSFVDIGKIYGVSDNAIRKWCIIEKLPKSKRIIQKYSDDEWNKI